MIVTLIYCQPKVIMAETRISIDRSMAASSLTPEKISLKGGMRQSRVSYTTAPNQNILINTQ